MQKLLYIVVEQLFKSHACILNAVHKVLGSLAQQFEAFFETDNVLGAYWIDASALIQDLDGTCRHLGEETAKLVASPFDTVKCLLGEHFKRAMGDLVVIFRVILTSIAFRLIRENYLNVALWSKCTTLKQWSLG